MTKGFACIAFVPVVGTETLEPCGGNYFSIAHVIEGNHEHAAVSGRYYACVGCGAVYAFDKKAKRLELQP